eukprot:g3330.t1
MQELGLQPNEVTYTALLRARLLSGDLLGAEDLQNELNVVGYTLLIDAYARVGNVEKAEAAVDALSMNAAPNLATYTALMKAYSRAHQLQGAEAVMSRMKAQGLEPNSITYVTLIAAHGKAKSLQRAEELYKEQGPNLASATAMIGAYGRAKDAERAQGVFDELCAQTVRPDAICCRQLSQALTGARPQSERKVYCKLQPSFKEKAPKLTQSAVPAAPLQRLRPFGSTIEAPSSSAAPLREPSFKHSLGDHGASDEELPETTFLCLFARLAYEDELACFDGHPLKIDRILFAPGRKHLKVTYPGTGTGTIAFVCNFDLPSCDRKAVTTRQACYWFNP